MKKLALALLVTLPLHADSWTPEKGLTQIPLWPKPPGNFRPLDDPETMARKPTTNVSNPTYTIYRPKGKANGTAILIFPGGGHIVLAMGLEGSDIAHWLTKSGITCVVVKYRVPYSGCYWDPKTRKHTPPKVPTALQDAQRAISTIRANADQLGIDPKKIGVMGFSAGGNVAVLASTRERAYKPVDAIDRTSCRPDFAIPVYPGHITMHHRLNNHSKDLNTDIPIHKNIPPTLLVHAEDDPVDPVHYSEVYAAALKKAGTDVTLKIYPTGGHAFGVRVQGKHSDRWTQDTLNWLRHKKFL